MRATGIDITAALLEQAQERQARLNVENVEWHQGEVRALAYPDESFTIVTSRDALHHCESAGDVLAEMVRVCCPAGMVAVLDVYVSVDVTKAQNINRMEKHHDSSHTRALPLSELRALFVAAAVEAMVLDTLDTDSLGVNRRLQEGRPVLSYPIVEFVCRASA